MKKYIAPVAKYIDLMSEGSLMTLSNEVHNMQGHSEASNERDRSASSNIWGFDE